MPEISVRGDVQQHLDRGGLELVQGETDGPSSGDHADLIEVGRYHRRAVRDDRPGELGHRELRATHVYMPVDETRAQVPAPRVDDLGLRTHGVLYVADSRDPVPLDGHARRVDLAAIDVDQLAVHDHQVGRSFSPGDIGQFIPIHADRPPLIGPVLARLSGQPGHDGPRDVGRFQSVDLPGLRRRHRWVSDVAQRR